MAPVKTETSVIYVKIVLNFNDGYQTLKTTTVFDDILLLDEAFAFVLREQVEDKGAS